MANNRVKYTPTITIVMPVYNVSLYVERCLQSVMMQSFPATECIIVDDASTDNSIVLCQRLIEAYSGPTHFVILYHNKNRGLSAARNTGTGAATSDYIYYLDSDDEIKPDCLEKLVSPIFFDDSIEMVMGDYQYNYSSMPGLGFQLRQYFENLKSIRLNSSRNRSVYHELSNNDQVYKWFYNKNNPSPAHVWNKLLKLSFIRNNSIYNKDGFLFEDTLWTYYLMRKLNHAFYLYLQTYVHYIRPDSIVTSMSFNDRQRYMGYIFRTLSREFVPGERLEETNHWLEGFYFYYINASKAEDYQYAYSAFLKQLNDGKHRKEVLRLKIVNCMAKSWIGRNVYNGVERVTRIAKRVLIW